MDAKVKIKLHVTLTDQHGTRHEEKELIIDPDDVPDLSLVIDQTAYDDVPDVPDVPDVCDIWPV